MFENCYKKYIYTLIQHIVNIDEVNLWSVDKPTIYR